MLISSCSILLQIYERKMSFLLFVVRCLLLLSKVNSFAFVSLKCHDCRASRAQVWGIPPIQQSPRCRPHLNTKLLCFNFRIASITTIGTTYSVSGFLLRTGSSRQNGGTALEVVVYSVMPQMPPTPRINDSTLVASASHFHTDCEGMVWLSYAKRIIK